MMKFIIFLAACLAVCSASGCKSSAASAELQALPASYKSHQNYTLFGKLTACPRIDEVLSDSLRFVVTPKEGIDVALLNDRVGDFMFSPTTNYTGIVKFQYYVEDDEGRSRPSTVTINVQPKIPSPTINVSARVLGLEDRDTELNVQIDDVQDERWNNLSISICSCAKDVTCSREDGCRCHLSLPDGWQIFSGDQQLTLEELQSLSPTSVGNLVLRAAPSSAAEHCLDVNVIDLNNGQDPSISKKSLNIRIHPVNTILVKPQPGTHTLRPTQPTPELPDPTSVNMTTNQGRPVVFHDLRLMDVDGISGTFMVTISLDRGGLLWVKQHLREDVVFLPFGEERHVNDVTTAKGYRLLHRFGTFRPVEQPGLEQINNGVRVLGLIGTLEGINAVLSTLTFVPWCPDWPVPPSWPVPAESWMIPADEDDHQHVIWPQWYPRFWNPFPDSHWTRWPRVLPPWWMSSPCSNWTSTVRMTVREVPPSRTCQQGSDEGAAAPSVSEWSAKISVNTSGKVPKSLVTSNHFIYFRPDSRVVIIDTVYLRSLQYEFGENLTVNLTVLEADYATAVFPSTEQNYTICRNIEQCNEQLSNIKVTFKNGVQDVCLVPVQVDMYRQGSSGILDKLVVWAVNTTSHCADVTASRPNFELHPQGQRRVMMRNGAVNHPLNLVSSVDGETVALSGILHVKLYAEHGIITMKVPEDLRIYSDHMGQHENISSYLSIAGPVPTVLEALAMARFTPFEFLTGLTVVTVDYRLPSTASQLLYGSVQPFRRTHVIIEVFGGMLPYMPVALHPQAMCVSESSVLYLNNTAVLRRFLEDERVVVTFDADRGSVDHDSSLKMWYDCPHLEDSRESEIDGEECSHHSDCPSNLLCCPSITDHQEVEFTCVKGTLRTELEGGMIGETNEINEVISLNGFRYHPAPCNEEEETYTDTIYFFIYPNRNPEGDNVRAYINVHVTCDEQSPSEHDGDCGWSDWTSCNTEGSVCGVGSQLRRQLCNPGENPIETRPCLNCTCAPALTSLLDPTPDMEGCTSDRPVSKCPVGCSVGTYHLETVSFHCSPAPDEPGVSRETNIKIHDTCICDYCNSYQNQRQN